MIKICKLCLKSPSYEINVTIFDEQNTVTEDVVTIICSKTMMDPWPVNFQDSKLTLAHWPMTVNFGVIASKLQLICGHLLFTFDTYKSLRGTSGPLTKELVSQLNFKRPVLLFPPQFCTLTIPSKVTKYFLGQKLYAFCSYKFH